MHFRRPWLSLAVALMAALGCALANQAGSAGDKKSEKKNKEVWKDTADPTLPADFKFQGEYVSSDPKFGCQIVALGNGQFQAVVLPGGLPGAGWDGKNKSLMQGQIEGDKATFAPATGKRRYLANSPAEFSATSKFPPTGQQDYSGSCDGTTLKVAQGDLLVPPIVLTRIVRKSPTLGMKPQHRRSASRQIHLYRTLSRGRGMIKSD